MTKAQIPVSGVCNQTLSRKRAAKEKLIATMDEGSPVICIDRL